MKQKLLPKYLLTGIIAFSVFSFVYVNLHAAYSTHPSCGQQKKEPQPVIIEEEDKAANIPVPDVTIVTRMFEILQRFTSTNQ